MQACMCLLLSSRIDSSLRLGRQRPYSNRCAENAMQQLQAERITKGAALQQAAEVERPTVEQLELPAFEMLKGMDKPEA